MKDGLRFQNWNQGRLADNNPLKLLEPQKEFIHFKIIVMSTQGNSHDYPRWENQRKKKLRYSDSAQASDSLKNYWTHLSFKGHRLQRKLSKSMKISLDNSLGWSSSDIVTRWIWVRKSFTSKRLNVHTMRIFIHLTWVTNWCSWRRLRGLCTKRSMRRSSLNRGSSTTLKRYSQYNLGLR